MVYEAYSKLPPMTAMADPNKKVTHKELMKVGD